jgi:hypothetical protein
MNKKDITSLIRDMYNGIAPYTSQEQCAGIAAGIAIKHIKFHVKAALKAAAENGEVDYFEEGNYEGGGYTCVHYVNKESILNAYPLTQIK